LILQQSLSFWINPVIRKRKSDDNTDMPPISKFFINSQNKAMISRWGMFVVADIARVSYGMSAENCG
jgi:hypothetical protein